MGIASNIISVIIKSVVNGKLGDGLGSELIGISIDEYSNMGVDKLKEFIDGEKLKIEHILSNENMKTMDVAEENIDFVVVELKDLLSKVEIADRVFRECKYSNENLKDFLWNKYCRDKDIIENESEKKKGLYVVAKTLIELMRESENFEQDFLIQISNAVDDTNVELQKICDYMHENYGSMNEEIQMILVIVQMILEQVHNKDSKENDIKREEKFKNNIKQDYIDNWNSRLFLHQDNAERPITLAEAFIMPDYTLYKDACKMDLVFEDKLNKVIHKFIKYNKNSTLLITGVPGIGKSSVIAWTANKYKGDDRVIVLRFRDWEYEDLQQGVLKAIFIALDCKRSDLENKVLIIDGFDEIKSVKNRKLLLSDFLNEILDYKNFKVIITSRPDYLEIEDFKNVVSLHPFNISKINKFHHIIKGREIDIYKLNDISIIGIPVILYMAIMSNIDITEDATRPELYNRIFAEKGGIFDRFSYEGDGYEGGMHPLRKKENINAYLKFLRNVAFKMFEKKKLSIRRKDCNIPTLHYQGGYIDVLEFPIKYFFESVEVDIVFIHKSIYEYFVSEYFFVLFNKKIDESKKTFAEVLGKTFKENRLSSEIVDFLKYKFMQSGKLSKQYDYVYEVFHMMLENGMLFYTNKNYKNKIDSEMCVFANMLDILHLWDNVHLELNEMMCKYIRYNRYDRLNLKHLSINESKKENIYLNNVYLVDADLSDSHLEEVDLSGSDLCGVNFTYANLNDADLTRANLLETDFRNALLRGAKLEKADLKRAKLNKLNLRGINLRKVDMQEADLFGVVFDEHQISYLKKKKYSLSGTNVFIKKSEKIVSYEKYCYIKQVKDSICKLLKNRNREDGNSYNS